MSLDEKAFLNLEGHSGNVVSVGFINESNTLYSGSEDGTVKLWDLRSNKWIESLECGGAVNTATIHPNRVDIFSGDQNGCVKIWDLKKMRCRDEFTPSHESAAVRSISLVRKIIIIILRSLSDNIVSTDYNYCLQRCFRLS